MRWWCSATAAPWTWTPIAYPGVWLVEIALVGTYWRLTRAATSRRGRAVGWIGVALLAAALDWPIGPLAAGYLASVHALQFLLVVLIAPPLVLLGVRDGIVQRWPASGPRERALRRLLDPLLAAIAFNVIVIATHVPGVNDTLMRSQLGSFAVDAAWLLAGLWFWWPLIVPVPRRPLFAVPLQMLYLFLGTMAHTGIAIVMLAHDFPMYAVYELAPRITGLSALDDLKTAGGVMELGGAAIVFGVLTAMFFRWAGGTGREQRAP